MNEPCLISIIVPVYNVEKYLPRCLETIAMQTYENIEIILVDDGSTDGSGKICNSFAELDNRAKVIHQQNLGLWAARNSGQREAKGDYLMFVDGDDYLHKDAITYLHTAITQNEGYDLAICGRKYTSHLSERINSEVRIRLKELSQEELVSNMFNHDDSVLFVYQWNKLYPRNVINNIWSNDYSRSQDFDYNFRVYLNVAKAIWIQNELYFYVQRPTSLIHQSNAVKLQYICRTDLLYRNFVNLPMQSSKYKHYLLKKLYRNMVFLKGLTWKTIEENDSFRKCQFYERKTIKAYCANLQIPFCEKIGVLLLLHSPRLTRWMMKVTKNY